MRRRTTSLLLLTFAPALALAAPTPAAATHPFPQNMTVDLRTAAGGSAGTVRLSAVTEGTLVQVDVRGLTPGFHGFHVHTTGVCDGSTTPPFTSAGGHFDSATRAHGAHSGDLPPLYAGADGTARAVVVTDAFTLSDLSPEDGTRSRAFVVHAAADNLANIPTRYRYGGFTDTETGPDSATLATGDSGGRVLCGVTTGAAAGAASPAAAGAPSATATLRTAGGTDLGTLSARQLGDRVELRGRLTGLTPGFHGFHVHTTGVCDGTTATPFSSAGGHLVGAGGTHGSHDGDLPALRVRADGTVDVDVDVDALSVDKVFDADGAAFVVHAGPDNLANIPARYRYGTFAANETGPDAATKATGDSGGRFGCGVLRNIAGAYRATGPTRVLDTRTGAGPLGSGPAAEVRVVPSGDSASYDAAILTVTAVGPSADTRITVGRPDQPVTVTAPRGQVTATSVVARVSSAGTVTVAATGGTTHVIVDVTGLYAQATPIGAGRYTAVTPSRAVSFKTLGAGASDRVPLTGRAGIPGTGVAAVTLTLTATRATTTTHLVAFRSGDPRPSTSSLNVRANQTRAVTVTVPVGTDGAVTVANNSGNVSYIVDVLGWWSAGDSTVGGRLVSLPPYDVPAVGLSAGRATEVVLAGVGGVPARGARAVVLAVTVAQPSAPSHLTVHAAGDPLPGTSNLNWLAGETLTTTVIVPLGRGGAVTFFNAGGTARLQLQVRGYLDAGSP